jgi:hypothetical protein
MAEGFAQVGQRFCDMGLYGFLGDPEFFGDFFVFPVTVPAQLKDPPALRG